MIRISAVIPAYNAEKYIARAIDSILSQTHPVDEIIVVDDGSTDGTAGIIKSYEDKVCYIYQENAGECGARSPFLTLMMNGCRIKLSGRLKI